MISIGSDARDLAPAVTRSIRILDILAEHRGEAMSLTEIAAAIGAAKSSTSNLCAVLEDSGLIQRRRGGGYALGSRTAELGGAYISSFDQLQEFHRLCLASPHLSQQLVKVALLDGTEVLYLARHEGRAPLQLAASIGARFPAASTAVGNVLLAALDDEEIARRFAVPGAFPRWTATSVADLETLVRRVDLARRRGWADDEGAVLAGMQGLAVVLPPVYQHETPLALGVSFPAAETSEEEREELLAELCSLRDDLIAPFQAMRPGGGTPGGQRGGTR
ncbi:IclR family transcriptional regulator [Auraticoccus monumenti]|uniref:DNA-binding transcriptional regulator, IclR family n=1 Tax=Auraticoccus monumenti TaxID=675864 RepID=A0A1G6Y3X6_9ACTN|nr:IclR family transcriptional regulator C-terminal domain-containing protein [Auraticoccus monumenti]SDD85108.1 DNA-binding transcriptional regulator, IclR family [Auraticoccus monumenti]